MGFGGAGAACRGDEGQRVVGTKGSDPTPAPLFQGLLRGRSLGPPLPQLLGPVGSGGRAGHCPQQKLCLAPLPLLAPAPAAGFNASGLPGRSGAELAPADRGWELHEEGRFCRRGARAPWAGVHSLAATVVAPWRALLQGLNHRSAAVPSAKLVFLVFLPLTESVWGCFPPRSTHLPFFKVKPSQHLSKSASPPPGTPSSADAQGSDLAAQRHGVNFGVAFFGVPRREEGRSFPTLDTQRGVAELMHTVFSPVSPSLLDLSMLRLCTVLVLGRCFPALSHLCFIRSYSSENCHYFLAATLVYLL